VCGLAGLATTSQVEFDHRAVVAALRHRGPDGSGYESCTTEAWAWHLAHTRLSIVDLSNAGTQPMSTEDDRLVMVFNGEIYNSPELRALCLARGHRFKSEMDGEVILHLWEMEGPAALRKLNGIFAIALADRETGELFLARDPLGVKPLFFSSDRHNTMRFASELSVFETLGSSHRSSDVVGLAQFLTFLWIPDPRTPYEGVESLKPGYLAHWRQGNVEVKPYADLLLPESQSKRFDADAVVRETEARFTAAARRQLLADVPIGLMASGGIDSGLIWSATRDSIARAYCIQWPRDDAGENLDEDTEAVKDLEQRFGTGVTYLPGENADSPTLPPSGDLFADPAYGLTRLIASSASSDGLKVLLSGQGGDELFAGYRRHTLAPWIARLRLGRLAKSAEGLLKRVPSKRIAVEYGARLIRAAGERDPFRGYMQLCSYSSAEDRARVLDCTVAEVSDDVVWQRHREVFDMTSPQASFLRRIMAVDLTVYMPGLGLAYVDRAGMEFGVEIRVPWLDVEFARWTLALPDDVLLRRGRGKWVTRELMARQLSPELAHRRKRGFAAPTHTVRTSDEAQGTQGFRQAVYFDLASRVLRAHLASGSLAASA